jgi:hypothetical protein
MKIKIEKLLKAPNRIYFLMQEEDDEMNLLNDDKILKKKTFNYSLGAI